MSNMLGTGIGPGYIKPNHWTSTTNGMKQWAGNHCGVPSLSKGLLVSWYFMLLLQYVWLEDTCISSHWFLLSSRILPTSAHFASIHRPLHMAMAQKDNAPQIPKVDLQLLDVAKHYGQLWIIMAGRQINPNQLKNFGWSFRNHPLFFWNS